MFERDPKAKKFDWTQRKVSDFVREIGGVIDKIRDEFMSNGRLPPWLDTYRSLRQEYLDDHPGRLRIPKEVIDELMQKAQIGFQTEESE